MYATKRILDKRRKPFDKKDLGNQLKVIESVPFILLMDSQLMKIPYLPFFLVMKVTKIKSRRTLFRKPLEKQVRKGDITPAISSSQEEEVPQQANFTDDNLDINM